MSSLFLVIPILWILMFCLGLELQLHDFSTFRKEPKALWIGLIGQLVLLPLVAWITIWLFDLPPLFSAGIMLIACCPGGTSSNAFTLLAGGNVALSVTLTALSSLITIISIPLVMSLLISGGSMIDLPIGQLLIQNIVLMLFPLCLGMTIRRYRKHLSEQLSSWIKRYALFLLLILVIVFFFENRSIIIDHFAIVGSATAFLLFGALCLGALLSKFFTLALPDSKAIFIEIGMQNAAQAISIASSPFVFNSNEMAVPAVIYALLMNVVLLTYVQIARMRRCRK